MKNAVATGANNVTVAKNLYMEQVTNVKAAEMPCTGTIYFSARSAPMKHKNRLIFLNSAKHGKKR